VLLLCLFIIEMLAGSSFWGCPGQPPAWSRTIINTRWGSCSLVYPSLETIQAWRCPPSLVTWPGTVPPSEEAFPQVQPKSPGAQFVIITLRLITWNHPEELGSSTFSCGLLVDILLASSLLRETNPAPSTAVHGACALGPWLSCQPSPGPVWFLFILLTLGSPKLGTVLHVWPFQHQVCVSV